jgi:hypothetical protein
MKIMKTANFDHDVKGREKGGLETAFIERIDECLIGPKYFPSMKSCQSTVPASYSFSWTQTQKVT